MKYQTLAVTTDLNYLISGCDDRLHTSVPWACSVRVHTILRLQNKEVDATKLSLVQKLIVVHAALQKCG